MDKAAHPSESQKESTGNTASSALVPVTSASSLPQLTFSENSSSLVKCIPNERATFFVKIDCPDDPEILPLKFEWSRGELPIENSDRFRITQTSNAVQLAVEHVQREDAGHYTLYARTKAGNVIRKDVELVVEDRSTGDDPPIFLRRLGDLSVKVGTRTRLLVEIRSSTDVKITWYRNDRRICENDRIKQINEGSFYCVEITPVILEDGGQWMVMVENLGGRNSCIAHLNVLVPKAYKSPEFIEELRAVLTDQGTVSLECKVVGIPTPVLRWFKDSKEIKAGDVFALTANPDDPTSLGTYTCEAVNCMGKTYSSSKVHVVGRGSREGSLKPADSVQNNAPPPIFTNELRGTSVRIGDTIILGCQVVVPPWPKTVAWYNKEGRVEANDKYKLIEDGLGVYMIEIKPSENCDEGEWKCVVTSQEGCVGISSCSVAMDIPKNYRKPRFMESLKAVLTEEGLVSFECKVVGFPTPTLKWFKDGQELKPGDVYQLTGTNSLGTYCCIAKNCMGENSSVAVLTIEDIENQLNDEERIMFTKQNQPPKFVSGLKTQDAKINEPFRFTVTVKALPDPVLSWFRDELPIESNERYNHYAGESETYHLDVKCVEFVDQAEWKCVAVNDFGTSVTSCFLKLQIPRHFKKPRFLECLRAVLTEEGAVNLECKVIGVPQPVLKWYKDGIELKPGDIHRIISGQDGTCCLGTYTCEARNCMGVVASSASLLGFEDAYKNQKAEPPVNELQRNFSLSTIQEERTSQMYESAVGDISIDEKGDISFSFDGKEVSVSLYETPDLTEEEALKIVEMYADQISEHVTEQNIVELPPLRFIKETSQSGNLLMEAVVIDIAPDYFVHEEDMRTEAGMDDISICEVTIHGSSGGQEESLLDKETEEFAKKNIEKMEEELALAAPMRKRKKSRGTEMDEYFSLSVSKASESQGDEDTSELQTFASASNQMTSSKIESLEMEENLVEGDILQPPKRKKDKKSPDTDSSKTTDAEALLQDVSGAAGDGLQLRKPSKVVTDEGEIEKNLKSLLPLAKLLKTIETHLVAVESEVTTQSAMMMSPTSAEQSIGIIRNVLEPIKQIQGKMKVYSGEIPIEVLFQSMEGDIKALHTALQVIEKCVAMDETGMTLIQRTSVCIIDSVGEQFVKTFEEVKNIANNFESVHIKMETDITAEDIQQGIQITQDTIKSQALLQEAQDIETAQHVSDSVAKLQTVPQTVPFDAVTEAKLPSEADSLKLICRPVIKIQQALENIENELSMEENEEELYSRVHEMAFTNLQGPIDELQLEVDKIEQKVVAAAGNETIEQKINMTILDIVSPPLFELKKGLEIISKQSVGNIHSGMMTVSAIESMVPPLQEIQNGLAQLGQDIEFGQVKEDFVPDSADTQKLLQSLAQAVLHFESNIERLSPRLSPNLQGGLVGLKDELSRLIGNILDSNLNKYRLTVLENLKTPIDELNYCLRQTEQKSISGSLSDLIDPIRSLREKVQLGEDILSISDVQKNDLNIGSLVQIRKIIKAIEIDIEEHEFRLLQKEIELDEKQATEVDQSFVSMREALSLQIAKEEGQKTIKKIEEIHECLATLQNEMVLEEVNTLTADNISILKKMAKPVKEMLECVALIKSGTAFDTVEHFNSDVNVKVLQEIAEPISDLAVALKVITKPKAFEAQKSLSTHDDISALKTLAQPVQELRNCIAKLGQEVAFDEQVQSFDEQQAILKIAKPLNELQDCLDGLIQQTMVETMEDASTLEEVSTLKSAGETSSQQILLSKEEQPLVELELDNTKQQKAEALLTDLKRSLTSVVAYCSQYDVSSLKGDTLNKLHATVTKLKHIEKCVAEVCEASVRDPIGSVSEGTDQRTLAEAVLSLESCILQVQDYFPEEDLKSLSSESVPISNLKASLSAPLQELRECLQVFHTQEFENVDTFTAPKVSLASIEVLEELTPFIVAVQENQALETLQNLVDIENLEKCKQIIAPIQQLQQAVLVHDQHHISQVDKVSSQSALETFAKPLMSLQEAIINIQEQYPYSTFETCPEFKILQGKSNAIYQLLKYVEHINCEALDNVAEMSTQADVSALETYAASLEGSEIMQAIQTEQRVIEPADIKACVEDGIKQIDSCLDKPTFKKSKDLKEVEIVMKELRSSFQQMQAELSKESEGESSILAKSNIARTLFKLKECLVHTYEGGYEESLDDIEKTFEDILQALPELEVLLAEQMSSKILTKISETVGISECCAENHDAHMEFMKRLVIPLNELAADIEILGRSSETEVSKSSAQMVGLQSRLMNAFRALNEVSESVPNELLDHVLTGQSVLVSVFDFIEATDSLRVIELIQEIDNLLVPLSGINEFLSETLRQADGKHLYELLKPVKEAQELLTTVQEQLASGSELATKLATANEFVILQQKIEKIENEILAKENLSQLTVEEVKDIQSITEPLEKLQESLVEFATQQRMEMSTETTHKRKADAEQTESELSVSIEEKDLQQVPEKKSRLSESSPEKLSSEKLGEIVDQECRGRDASNELKMDKSEQPIIETPKTSEVQEIPTHDKSKEMKVEESEELSTLRTLDEKDKFELKTEQQKIELLDLETIKSQIGSDMFKSFESLRILKERINEAKEVKVLKASQEILSTLEITVTDLEKLLVNATADTIEDTLFLPLFKMRDLLAFIKQNPELYKENTEILDMANKVFTSILNHNVGLRRAFLQDIVQTPKDEFLNIIPLLEEAQGLETCRSVLTVVQELDSLLTSIVTKNEAYVGRSSEAFIKLQENLNVLREQAEDLGKRLPAAFRQSCVEPLVKICKAVGDSKTEDVIEVLQEMEALKGPLKVLKETIARNIKNFKESQELEATLTKNAEKKEQISEEKLEKVKKSQKVEVKPEEKREDAELKTRQVDKTSEEKDLRKEVADKQEELLPSELLNKDSDVVKAKDATTSKSEAKKIENIEQTVEPKLTKNEDDSIKLVSDKPQQSKDDTELEKNIEAEKEKQMDQMDSKKKKTKAQKETIGIEEISGTKMTAEALEIEKLNVQKAQLLDDEKIELHQIEDSKKEITTTLLEAESKNALTMKKEKADIEKVSETTNKAQTMEIEEPKIKQAKLLAAEKIKQERMEECKKELEIIKVEGDSEKADLMMKETTVLEELNEHEKKIEKTEIELANIQNAQLVAAENKEEQKVEDTKSVQAEADKSQEIKVEEADLKEIPIQIETESMETKVLKGQAVDAETIENQTLEDSRKVIETEDIELLKLKGEKHFTEPENLLEIGKVSSSAIVQEESIDSIQPQNAQILESKSDVKIDSDASMDNEKCSETAEMKLVEQTQKSSGSEASAIVAEEPVAFELQKPVETAETVSEVDTTSIVKTLEIIANLSEESETTVASAINELKDLNEQLASGISDEEKLLQSVRKAFFKLRECIVHTYDGSKAPDDEEESKLKVIDEAFKDILESNSFVKNHICNELLGNTIASIENLKTSLRENSTQKLPKELEPLVQPLMSLKESIEVLLKSDDDLFEKSSNKMISLQTCLMNMFFEFDDLASIQEDKDVKATLVSAQDIILKIHDHFDVPKQFVPKIKISEDLSRLCGPMERILKLLAVGMIEEEELKLEPEDAKMEVLEKPELRMIVEQEIRTEPSTAGATLSSKNEESKAEEEEEKAPKHEKIEAVVAEKEMDEGSESQKLEEDQQMLQKIAETEKTENSMPQKLLEVKDIAELEHKSSQESTAETLKITSEVTKEENKLEDTKKELRVEDITAKQSTADVSVTKAEEIETKKLEDNARKLSLVDVKINEPHSAKIAEVKEAACAIVPDAKKSLDIIDFTTEGKVAEKSVTKPEIIDEKSMDSLAQKPKDTQAEPTIKQNAEKSFTEAESIVEERYSESTQKADVVENIPIPKIADVSEIKAETMETKSVEDNKIKAQIIEVVTEGQSGVKSVTEPLVAETEKMEVNSLKLEIKEIKASDTHKAEVSEVKLQQLEKDKVLDSKLETILSDVTAEVLVAQKSLTEAEEIRFETLSNSEQQKKEDEIKSAEAQVAEVSEIKLEQLEKNTLDDNKTLTKVTDVTPEAMVAQKTLTEAEEVRFETLSTSEQQKKEDQIKSAEAQVAEVSEIKLEQVEKNKLDDNKTVTKVTDVTPEAMVAQKTLTEAEEVKFETLIDSAQQKKQDEIKTSEALTAKVSEVKLEKIEQNKVDGNKAITEVKDVTPEAMIAQKSLTEAEEVRFETLSSSSQQIKQDEIESAEAQVAEVSDIKLEQLEKNKVDDSKMETKVTDVTPEAIKAQKSITEAEEVKFETLSYSEQQKKEEQIKSTEAQVAKSSEIKLEAIEILAVDEDKLQISCEDISPKKLDAEKSTTKADTVKIETVSDSPKKVEEEFIKPSEQQIAEVSEVKFEKIEQIAVDDKKIFVSTEDILPEKLLAEKSITKLDPVKVEEVSEDNKMAILEILPKTEGQTAIIDEIKPNVIETKTLEDSFKKSITSELSIEAQEAQKSTTEAEKLEVKKLMMDDGQKLKVEKLDETEANKANISEVKLEEEATYNKTVELSTKEQEALEIKEGGDLTEINKKDAEETKEAAITEERKKIETGSQEVSTDLENKETDVKSSEEKKEDDLSKPKRRKSKASPEKKKVIEPGTEIAQDEIQSEKSDSQKMEPKPRSEEKTKKMVEQLDETKEPEVVPVSDKPEEEQSKVPSETNKSEEKNDNEVKKIKRRKSKTSPQKKKEGDTVADLVKDDLKSEKTGVKAPERGQEPKEEKLEQTSPQIEPKKEEAFPVEVATFKFNILKNVVEAVKGTSSNIKEIKILYADLCKLNDQVQVRPNDDSLLKEMANMYLKLREKIVNKDDLSASKAKENKLVELKSCFIEALEPNHELRRHISNNLMKSSLTVLEKLKTNLMENSSKKTVKVLVPFIEPLSNIQTAVESLTKSDEKDYDKSSGRMVNLQSCLMDVYFTCDDTKPQVHEKLQKTVELVMKVMLQVHDKVENAVQSVDRVVMSETIEDISIPLKQFHAILLSIQDDEGEKVLEEVQIKKTEEKLEEKVPTDKALLEEEKKDENIKSEKEIETKSISVVEEDELVEKKTEIEELSQPKPLVEDKSLNKNEKNEKITKKKSPSPKISPKKQKSEKSETVEVKSKSQKEEPISDSKKEPVQEESMLTKKENEDKPTKIISNIEKVEKSGKESKETQKKSLESQAKMKEEPVMEDASKKVIEETGKLEPSSDIQKTEDLVENVLKKNKTIDQTEVSDLKAKKEKESAELVKLEETKTKPSVSDVGQQKLEKTDISELKAEGVEKKDIKETEEKIAEVSETTEMYQDIKTQDIDQVKTIKEAKKIDETTVKPATQDDQISEEKITAISQQKVEEPKKKEQTETKTTVGKKASPKKKVTKKEVDKTSELVSETSKREEELKLIKQISKDKEERTDEGKEMKEIIDKSEIQVCEKTEKEAIEISEKRIEDIKEKKDTKSGLTKKTSPKKQKDKKKVDEGTSKLESQESSSKKPITDIEYTTSEIKEKLKSSEEVTLDKPAVESKIPSKLSKKPGEVEEILDKQQGKLKTEIPEANLEEKTTHRNRAQQISQTKAIEESKIETGEILGEISDKVTEEIGKTEISQEPTESKSARPSKTSESSIPEKIVELSSYEIKERKKESKRAPNFDLKLTNRNSPLGSDIKLTCCISGSDVSVQWFKDKTPVKQDSKHLLSYVDGLSSLEVRSVEKTDSGIYRCIASNRNGDIETSCLVSVYEVPTTQSGTPPIFTRNIRDTYQSHGNQITLECKVSGNPKPNIFWQKDNVLLEFPSEKYQIVELLEGIKQLIIANPNADDSGLYTCYAESIGGQMKLSKFLDVTDHIKVHKEEKNKESQVEKVVVEDGKERAVRSREAKRKLIVEASLKNMVIGSGNKAQLLCNVSGPIDEVQWYKDGERVFKDLKHKIYNINGTLSLEIYDATVDDSGEYSCIAKNGQHQTEVKCSLRIYDSKSGYKPPPSFDSAIRESFDAHRNEIILECNVHGRPRITWLKDDHIISNNRYRQFEEAGGLRKLLIRNPISSDFGSFSCYAETEDQIEAIAVTLRAADLKKMQAYTNGHADNSSTDDSYKHYRSSEKDYDEEFIQNRSAIKASSLGTEVRRKPVFSMLLNDRTVLEGSNLRLSCNVVGGCEISWLKNHELLKSSSRYQKLFSNGQATLEIYSAQGDDSGNYACRAFNEYGEALSYAQVKVFQSHDETPQPPTFVRYMKDTYSLNEDELVLDCRVRGYPRPEIQWMKESDMLNADEKYRPISQSDGYCKLIINNPTEKDAGLYSCVARNSVKEEKITHQVDFKGKDRAALEKTHGFFHRDPNKPHLQNPLGNHTVTPGGTIAIMAEFLPTSSPIDVQWLRSKEPLTGQPNVRTFFDHGVYTLAISNAASEWEGTYTCRATNAYGRLETNAHVDIADKGGKAAGPPLFLSRPETEMKIAVGDPFSISFRLQGEPKPKLTLLKGTKDITKTDRVSKEASDDYIRFTVSKSQPSDSGTYFVVARNEFGTDRVFVTITVASDKKK